MQVNDHPARIIERDRDTMTPTTTETITDCPKARGEGTKHSHDGGFDVCTPKPCIAYAESMVRDRCVNCQRWRKDHDFTNTIVARIADGLDAMIDGRGFDFTHQQAFDLANAAPDMLAFIRRIAALTQDGDPPESISSLISDARELHVAIGWAVA